MMSRASTFERHWWWGAERAVASMPAQFVLYAFCAGLAGLVNFIAGSILVDGFGWNSALGFPLAVASAYTAGMMVNFLLNRRFTFASDRRGIAQARTFVVVALSGLLLTTAIAGVARAGLAAHDFAPGFLGRFAAADSLSRAIAIALAAVYSFAGHKYFTFKRGIRWPLLRLAHRVRFGGFGG